MRLVPLLIAALGGLLLVGSDPARAQDSSSCRNILGEKRVALIIGNSAYPSGRLGSPARDATRMHELLCGYGFQTTQAWVDRTSGEMEDLLRAFSANAADATQVVVYFSGHGAEIHGQAQFLGVDWRGPVDEAEEAAVPIANIKAALADSKARVKIVILDACRNRLMPTGRTQGAYQGTVSYPFTADQRLLLVYATQPGYTSSAEGPDGMSLFTSALVRRLSEPDWPWYGLFNQVAEDLSPAGLHQTPTAMGLIDHRIAPSILAEQLRFNPQDLVRPASSASPAQLATDSRSLYVYWRRSGASAAAGEADRLFHEALQLAQPRAAASQSEAVERLSQAVNRLREAARLGHIEAATNLGYHLATGKGVARDITQARLTWEAVASRSAAAANNLGVLARGHGSRDSNVQCDLPSPPPIEGADDVQAVRWFAQAHRAGLPSATTDLAYMKLEGRGTSRDCDGARALLELAAGRGDPSGVTWLGVALERGWGGPRDRPRADALIARAVELGDPAAMTWLASRYQRPGSSITKSDATGLFERAVATGSPEAEFSYASWIERHDAARIDRAIALYRRAAQGGVRTASGRLAQLERALGRLPPVPTSASDAPRP